MKSKNRPSQQELREAMYERLRYFAFVGRRNPKSLTLEELDELCQIVVLLAARKSPEQNQ